MRLLVALLAVALCGGLHRVDVDAATRESPAPSVMFEGQIAPLLSGN